MKRNFKKILSANLVVLLLLSVCAIGFTADAAEFVDYTPISTKEDLYNIRYNTSDKYYLTNDIVFNSSDPDWTPISSFSGILDGNGYSIKGLKFSSSVFDYDLSVGMINKMYGTICNLTMEDCQVKYHTSRQMYTDEETYLCIGIITGTNYGNIYNCHNSSKLNATADYRGADIYAGGIAGRNYEGIISDCSNSGILYSSYYIGGIVGFDYFGNIERCSNTASIYSDYIYAGVGGIVGYGENSNISECYNIGEICADYEVIDYTFTTAAGGIAAELRTHSKITNCYNTGTIYGTYAGGGIVGDMQGEIEKCFNTGTVISDHAAGGIVGTIAYIGQKGLIKNCFNVGCICVLTDYPRFAKAGGIAGQNDTCFIECCYNVSPVIATNTTSNLSDVASVAGYTFNADIKNCYYYNLYNDKGVDYGTDTTTAIDTHFDLSKKESYAGFDFNNVWDIDYDTGYTFPILMGMDYPDLGIDWQLALTSERNPGVKTLHTGKCGDNLTWSICSGDNMLIITGTGEMYDYSKNNPAPWSKFPVKKVAAITNGITSVGDYAFYNCDNIATVYLGYDVNTIGESAFENCDALVTVIAHKNLRKVGRNAVKDCENYVGTTFVGTYNQMFLVEVESGNDNWIMVSTYDSNDRTIQIIKQPSISAINYGDVIWLTVDESQLPAGGKIEWVSKTENLGVYKRDGNNIAIQSLGNGGTAKIFAIVFDENDNAMTDENGDVLLDYIEIETHYNFFMRIIYWLKSIFGMVTVYK